MAEIAQTPEGLVTTPEKTRKPESTLSRIAKYTGSRMLSLMLTVVLGIYLTVLIANMGGYVDTIRRSLIREFVSLAVAGNPDLPNMTTEEITALRESMIEVEVERQGLNRPFLLRSFSYLGNAMALNLGRSENMVSDTGSRLVRLIILERLPPTLVLFATSNFLLFFVGIVGALALSRRYGSFMDRVIIALAPTSAGPGWFYGLFLILIFAGLLGMFPFGGMVGAPPPANRLDYFLSLLRHLTLPLMAQIISSVFLAIYTWRTFFLIYSNEDYVELARAKGLSDNSIQQRYILRPTLPTIITTFALNLIALWQGAIILETVFNWPGLGRTLFQAINLVDTPVIIGSTVIYAYLLALTVFLLDFVYALVDPRVKVGSGASRA
ncbi:MAG: ABC transporter permease [Anaerolineales bacterium]|nr:ABC transporter permease [Anaerolineales bacterium]